MSDFMAVGADELGEPIGEQARCPNCKAEHLVRYGDEIVRDVDGTRRKVPSKMLAFIKCTENQALYLVGIDGKELSDE